MVWPCVCLPQLFDRRVAHMLGRRPPVLLRIMDVILRDIENLSRHELIWLMSYLDGRLRALPPEDTQESVSLQADAPGAPNLLSGSTQVGTTAPSLAPLSERIDSLNHSLDPWERTGAAPQGWAKGTFNSDPNLLMLFLYLGLPARPHLVVQVRQLRVRSLPPNE